MPNSSLKCRDCELFRPFDGVRESHCQAECMETGPNWLACEEHFKPLDSCYRWAGSYTRPMGNFNWLQELCDASQG